MHIIGTCGKEKGSNVLTLSKLGGNCKATSKKPSEEIGKMAQWVEHLPHKREDLSSDPEIKCVCNLRVHTARCGRRDEGRKVPGSLWAR